MKFILYAEQNFRYHEMVGGYMCFLEIAKFLARLGHEVACAVTEFTQGNCIFNRLIIYKNEQFGRSNFLGSPLEISVFLKNSIAIYGESVKGNPMRAPKVVRLIACELGIHNGTWHFNFWGKDDRVYFFNKEKRFDESRPEVYKNLNAFHLNRRFLVKSTESAHRKLSCHFFKKIQFYGDDLKYIHPHVSTELSSEDLVSYDTIREVFRSYKYFFCYDPCSFLPYLAALCGCTAVVLPIKGMSKSTWLKNHSSFKKIENVFGVAWGLEDLRWARRTRWLLQVQLNAQIELAQYTIRQFATDMYNWDECANLTRNIFEYRPNIYCIGSAKPDAVMELHGGNPNLYIVGKDENGDHGVYRPRRKGHNCGFFTEGVEYLEYLTEGENKIVFSLPNKIELCKHLIENVPDAMFYFSPVCGNEKYNKAIVGLFQDHKIVLH